MGLIMQNLIGVPMNKMHRTLWNAARGCYVVAHEKTATHGKASSTRTVGVMSQQLAVTHDKAGNRRKSSFEQKTLAAALLLFGATLGLPAWATCTLTGDGSSGSPYQVSSAADLAQVGLNCGMSKSYLQTADITLTGTNNLSPIGSTTTPPLGQAGQAFTGTYDGGNYTISGLNQSNTSASSNYRLGLFSEVTDATIKNLTLSNASLTLSATLSSMNDYIYAGALIGRLFPSTGASITNINVNNSTISVASTTNGRAVGGGVIGGIGGGNPTVSYSSATNVTITGSTTSSGYVHVGGFAGLAYGGTLSSLSSSGSVQATHTGGATNQLMAGGLIGDWQGSAAIQNVYSTTSVTGIAPNGANYWGLGGLIGITSAGSLKNTYATGTINGTQATALCATAGRCGGLVGTDFASGHSNNFWDTTTSGKSTSPVGTGKTTAEMKTAATFTGAGWDTSIWNIQDGQYPTLKPWTPPNAAPTANNLTVSGTTKAGETLTGSYTYVDTDTTPDAEGTSTFKWYSGSNSNGSGKSVINGATSQTYQAAVADIGKYLFFCVTPVAQTGTQTGSETCSAATARIGNGVLSDVSVVPSSTLTNATNVTYTLTYTTKNALPAYAFLLNGYLPAGVILPAISDVTSCANALTVKIDNVTQDLNAFTVGCLSFGSPTKNSLQITLKNALPAGKTVSIAITGVTNPATAGTSAATLFQTQYSSAIDIPATMPSITYTEVTAPGQPTNVSVSAGNASGTVSFTPPANNGGSVITGYTATCDLEGNYFASRITPPQASGTSSPITVTGLTNGTAYKCVVSATNAIGTGDDAIPSATFTPTAPPEPPAPPVNPFNPGGNSTVSDLNTTIPGGTSTYTPATNSLVTNLGNLENKVGVSDNGVVVITTTTNEPVKIKNDAPDNVLFALPPTNAVNLQIGGSNIQVTTNTEPVKDSTGKSVSTVLATRTMTNEQGQTTQTVQVEKGQATVQSTQANQIVGGLTLSKEGTLRDVTATGGNIGSTVGFFKNPNDLSGSVSAESGDATVFVKLSSAANQADRFAANTATSATTRTLTLKAGEVARFDKFGELIGVYAGSLSGTAGKTGDAITLTAPAGVVGYPQVAAKLDGNALGRLGNNLLPAFLAAILPKSANVTAADKNFNISQDATTGLVKITYYGRDYYSLPIPPVPVDPSLADGGQTLADGTVVATVSGVSVRFAPAVADISGLAKTAAQTYGISTQVKDDGTLKLTANGTVFFARPRFANDALGSTTQGFGINQTFNTTYVDADGQTKSYAPALPRLTYTGADGKTQVLDPTLYDASQMLSLIKAAGGDWQQQRTDNGRLILSGPNGERFALLPDYAVNIDAAMKGGNSTAPTAWVDNGKVVVRYNTGFLPMTQAFSVD